MRTKLTFALMLGMFAALIVGGCGTTDPFYGATEPTPQVASPRDVYPGTGVVQSIELVQQGSEDRGVGLGAIAGAVVGGVAGAQVGSGSGRTAATILGAAGGAYLGHELEGRRQQPTEAYKVTIRMDDGSHQALLVSTDVDFRVGDRVRVEGGVLYRN